MTEEEFEKLKSRIKRIEDFLFPPGGPGNPTIFDDIKRVEKELIDLRGSIVTREEGDRIWEELNSLKIEIAAIKRRLGDRDGGATMVTRG
ncbi:hypothetical protein [Thioclava sp. IC9]|uniref:hypothetical protein n=1 Tax=Thioclava sp. IC9 TaxID=1973007 RepID=UPI000B543EF7|nr:hypothetical protein [Thioclava sp. IC9]OWY02306.1 hypothetical protein B6V76_12855 [Thioclava sp. IC9]